MGKVDVVIRLCSSSTVKQELFNFIRQHGEQQFENRFRDIIQCGDDLHWGSVETVNVKNLNLKLISFKSLYFIPFNDLNYSDELAKIEVTIHFQRNYSYDVIGLHDNS